MTTTTETYITVDCGGHEGAADLLCDHLPSGSLRMNPSFQVTDTVAGFAQAIATLTGDPSLHAPLATYFARKALSV